MSKRICICGGGALGHIMISVISSKGYDVCLLTNHPDKWSHQIISKDLNGKQYIGNITKISSDPKDVIPESDIILLCLPGFLIDEEIKKIKQYLKENSCLGSIVSSTGFFISALANLDENAKLFGFQRVPYIARVEEYGKKATLLGYKKSLNMAFHGIRDIDALATMFSNIIDTPINILNHVFEATLTNSNPLLHPARLYTLFKDYKKGTIYPKETLFYEEWDDCSSEILIACDREFQELLLTLPVTPNSIPSLLEYYESYDKYSLTKKISSIEAFKKIKTPMENVDGGYIPDISSRYFTEDIPYGLLLIKYMAQMQNISTPNIDKIVYWCQNIMSKEYIKDGLIVCDSKDIKDISCLNYDVIRKLI